MSEITLHLESLQPRIAQTAAWRRNMALSFPHDGRNATAAGRLDDFAIADCTEVSSTVLKALAPYAGKTVLRDAVSAAARDCEFRRWPKTFDGFLHLVIEKIQAPTQH